MTDAAALRPHSWTLLLTWLREVVGLTRAVFRIRMNDLTQRWYWVLVELPEGSEDAQSQPGQLEMAYSAQEYDSFTETAGAIERLRATALEAVVARENG